MGGSGGSPRYRGTSSGITRRIAEARERERERLNTDVNEYLNGLLVRLNARETDETNQRLDRIADILGNVADIEKVLLGGSVAKHTYVDGISDIDALVVLDRQELQGKSPDEVKAAFYAELDSRLPRSEVAEVKDGRMAVTVRYSDGVEIQLLPALRSGSKVHVVAPTGMDWQEISPKRFQQALIGANQRLGRALVPAIKLLKSINYDLPAPKQLKPYHIEALAVDAAEGYDGPNVPREVLIHVCKHASERVMKPIKDITGQGRRLDEYLGVAGSAQRRIASQALASIGRRLETASSVGDWKTLLELEP